MVLNQLSGAVITKKVITSTSYNLGLTKSEIHENL